MNATVDEILQIEADYANARKTSRAAALLLLVGTLAGCDLRGSFCSALLLSERNRLFTKSIPRSEIRMRSGN